MYLQVNHTPSLCLAVCSTRSIQFIRSLWVCLYLTTAAKSNRPTQSSRLQLHMPHFAIKAMEPSQFLLHSHQDFTIVSYRHNSLQSHQDFTIVLYGHTSPQSHQGFKIVTHRHNSLQSQPTLLTKLEYSAMSSLALLVL